MRRRLDNTCLCRVRASRSPRSREGWLGSTRQAAEIRMQRCDFSLLSPMPLNSCEAQSLRSMRALHDASTSPHLPPRDT